jgi:pimeloyl-ACP methyl ester carboxylesterase
MRVPSFPSAQLLVFWGGHQAGFNGFHHNPVDYAAAVRCPILFLHGAADPRARIEEGRRVFDAVQAVKSFKEFPLLGHENLIAAYPDKWNNAVSEFLKKAENPGASVDAPITHLFTFEISKAAPQSSDDWHRS